MAGGKKKSEKKKIKAQAKPFVSVCTPTFNRRPFIERMIKCFDHQTYPKDKMEWIIIDDGTDRIEDLVASHPNVKYFRFDEKMPLGKKRNVMHEKSSGEILVYMDDDDYYPPTRVSHAVEMLQQHPKALCAGSSELYIWFHHVQKMYQFGPYGPRHATAGTFAFRRKLLSDSRYNDDASLAEEKAFLKDYSVPFVQLDPRQVILVFSHEHNTFDKRTLLNNPNDRFVKVSDKTVESFVQDEDMRKFYMVELHDALKEYEPGKPEMKPDVLTQLKSIQEQRDRMNEDTNNQHVITIQTEGCDPKHLTTNEVVRMMQEQQTHIQTQQQKINELAKNLSKQNEFIHRLLAENKSMGCNVSM